MAKSLPKGIVSIELAENVPPEAKIARFDEGKNNWEFYDTKIDGSHASTESQTGGIFAILNSTKK